jgi:hypothetical protein
MAIEDVIPQLVLCPLLESYNATLGNDVTTTQYDNGMPRQRLNGIGRPHQVQVSFRHKERHQEYILAFWRLHRARAFAMRLILDGTTMEWYECRFVSDSQPRVLGGGIFEFSISLVCKPKPLDLEVDSLFIAIYKLTKGDISGLNSALEKLVNEDLPES